MRGVRRWVPPSRPYAHTFDRFKNTSDSTTEQLGFKSSAMIKASMSLATSSGRQYKKYGAKAVVWERRIDGKNWPEQEEDLGRKGVSCDARYFYGKKMAGWMETFQVGGLSLTAAGRPELLLVRPNAPPPPQMLLRPETGNCVSQPPPASAVRAMLLDFPTDSPTFPEEEKSSSLKRERGSGRMGEVPWIG